jgi:adenylate cyclase
MSEQLEVPLEAIDECFEGTVPASICTASLDGTPNTAYLSIVQKVDSDHVALSRQFFNKTSANLLINPRCDLLLVEPSTGRQFRLDLIRERTDSNGPLFESMQARLEAVASQTGMTGIFKLQGVEVCRVLKCSPMSRETSIVGRPRRVPDVAALDSFSRRISAASSVDELITESLAAFDECLGLSHSLFMVLDELSPDRLYTVGSRGFESSGVGSEVRVGQGIVGVAVARKQALRIGHMEFERTYSRAVRSVVERQAAGQSLETEIELPGLPLARSHLAAPILSRNEPVGALYFQSEEFPRFREEDEHILSVAAREIGLAMTVLCLAPTAVTATVSPPNQGQAAANVKYYATDDSVFLDNQYLIKGVAGRILWSLLQKYTAERRVDFTNREMRLDRQLDLPELHENVETRLILLRKRLEERCDYIRIVSTGRGRFRLVVNKDLRLDGIN